MPYPKDASVFAAQRASAQSVLDFGSGDAGRFELSPRHDAVAIESNVADDRVRPPPPRVPSVLSEPGEGLATEESVNEPGTKP
jgi:hypothetical protein